MEIKRVFFFNDVNDNGNLKKIAERRIKCSLILMYTSDSMQ